MSSAAALVEGHFDMELFISEVEAEPAVWNYTSESYKNRIEKTKAWDKICTTLYPTYVEMSDKEKNDIVSFLQRKWKSLRDSYNRELKKVKSVEDPFSKRKYIYFDQLSFLQPLAEQRITLGQQEEKEHIKEEMADSMFEHEQDIMEEVVVPQAVPKKSKRVSVSREPTVELQPTLVDVSKAKKKKKNKLLCSKERDDAVLFCLSLVSDLKKIPDVLRTDAKCELLQVLKRYKIAYTGPHYPAYQPQYPPAQTATPYTDTSLLNLAKVEMGGKKKPRNSLPSPSSSDTSAPLEEFDE